MLYHLLKLANWSVAWVLIQERNFANVILYEVFYWKYHIIHAVENTLQMWIYDFFFLNLMFKSRNNKHGELLISWYQRVTRQLSRMHWVRMSNLCMFDSLRLARIRVLSIKWSYSPLGLKLQSPCRVLSLGLPTLLPAFLPILEDQQLADQGWM